MADAIRLVVDGLSPWLVLVAFALMAGAALWAVWPDGDVRPVGWAICASFIASNVVHLVLAPPERPAAYTVFEVLIASTAMLARVCGGPVLLVPLVVVSFLSVASNLVYSLHLAPSILQTQVWEIWTNGCYVIECVLIFWIGTTRRVAIRGRTRHDRNDAAVHAGLAREEGR